MSERQGDVDEVAFIKHTQVITSGCVCRFLFVRVSKISHELEDTFYLNSKNNGYISMINVWDYSDLTFTNSVTAYEAYCDPVFFGAFLVLVFSSYFNKS